MVGLSRAIRRATQPVLGSQVEQNAMCAFAVLEYLFDQMLLRVFVVLLRVHVMAHQVDRRIGAAAGRREGAHHALTQFTGAEVERQQTVRGGIGQQNLFAHGRECATQRSDQAGLAHAAGQREDSQHRSANLLLPDNRLRCWSCPGCSNTPFNAYQRAATRSRDCCRVSPTEGCGGGAID